MDSLSIIAPLIGFVGLSGAGSVITELLKVTPLKTDNVEQYWATLVNIIVIGAIGAYIHTPIANLVIVIGFSVPMSIGLYRTIIKPLKKRIFG